MTARLASAACTVALLVSTAVAGVSPTARAQSARSIGAAGIDAFHALDFEGSVRSLRSLLAGAGAPKLGDSVHAELLTYIGASELLLGRRSDAMRTFRAALEHAPEARADTLIFPPAITTAFEQARRGTALVVARPAGGATFVPGRGRIEFRLQASAPHVVRAAIQDAHGKVVRTLFDGPITDTLWIAWDGLVTSGAGANAGRVDFCVTSIDPDGIARTLRLPLEVERLDDEPTPSAGREPGIIPTTATTPGPPNVRATGITTARPTRWPRLLTGALAAVAVVVLPDVMSASTEPSSRRFVVGGALAAASIIAFRGAGRVPSPSAPGVRPPARLDPPTRPIQMQRPTARDALVRLRISPLASRARSDR